MSFYWRCYEVLLANYEHLVHFRQPDYGERETQTAQEIANAKLPGPTSAVDEAAELRKRHAVSDASIHQFTAQLAEAKA